MTIPIGLSSTFNSLTVFCYTQSLTPQEFSEDFEQTY